MVKLNREVFEFYLVIITVTVFTILGIIFLASTFYSWYRFTQDPWWTQTYSYTEYVRSLNILAFGLTIALIVTLFFCLERRTFSLNEGILATIFAITAGIIGWILLGISSGIIASMAVAFFFQVYLLTTIVTGREIRSEKAYLIEKIGLIILHASYALIVMSIGGMNEHPLQIPVFWTGTALSLVGKLLSFYGRNLVSFLKKIRTFNLT